jgi:hypothetical protein
VTAAVWTSGRRRALDYDFEVQVCDGGPVDAIVDYLSPFPELPGRARSRYVLTQAVEGTFDVLADAESIGASVKSWRAVALIGWHINQSVVEHSRARHVLLHASAAVKDGGAVVLAAPMEHGKTTTVTGLLRAGYSYVTDEAVAVDPASLQLTPYPKPLTIDRGAWKLFPDLRPSVTFPDAASWWVTAESIRPGAVVESADPVVVVLPAYSAGAVTELVPMGPTEATTTLAGCTFRFDDDPVRNLGVVAALARRCPTYRLTIGDLGEAVEAIDGLMRDRVRAA